MKRIGFVVLCFLWLAAPASAQEFSKTLKTVSDYNRVQPLQNPELVRTEKILTRRVADNKSKVIGEVQDVVIARNGSIRSLKVDFNRLHLGAPVYLNYSTLDIEPVGNTYRVGFADDEIEQAYPGLLAEMETAAGGDDDLSLRNIQGVPVQAFDGRDVGTVKDVLFASEGNRAEALYVTLASGPARGKGIAIPIKAATFGESGQKITAVISNELANAMFDFAVKK